MSGRVVAVMRRWLSRHMKPIDQLTPRERQIAQMLGEGKAPKVIAAELGIACVTVRQMIYRVMEKTGAKTAVHLALMVAREGLPD